VCFLTSANLSCVSFVCLCIYFVFLIFLAVVYVCLEVVDGCRNFCTFMYETL